MPDIENALLEIQHSLTVAHSYNLTSKCGSHLCSMHKYKIFCAVRTKSMKAEMVGYFNVK